jgi:hypothetical protein
VLFAGSVYTVVDCTVPRFPELYTLLPPALVPMSTQYAVAFASELQVNVADVPTIVDPGVGDCMAANPLLAFNAVYEYVFPYHDPLIWV